MKFFKGMLMGTLVSTGIMMMYTDNMNKGKKKIMKKGKQMAKKIGIL